MTKEEVKNKVFLNEDKLNEVSDKTIQDYEEFVLKERILSQGLVGDIVNGEYVISDELKHLFVINKKLLIKRENDFLIAKMDRLGKTFKFRLVFEDFDKDSMVAEFYIIEELNGETIETFVANFIDTKNYEFKQKARESFNILLEEDQYIKEDDEDFAALDNVIGRNKSAKSDERIFVLETYSELYIIDMLNALAAGGALSKKVLEEYKAEVKKQGLLRPNVPHVYMKLKDILDQVVEQNGGIKVLAEENKEVRKAIERYIVPVNDFDRTSKVIDSLNVKKEELKENVKETQVKPAAKSSGGEKSSSKSGSKSASKQKAKAKPKKKTAKKEDSKPKKGGVITFVSVFKETKDTKKNDLKKIIENPPKVKDPKKEEKASTPKEAPDVALFAAGLGKAINEENESINSAPGDEGEGLSENGTKFLTEEIESVNLVTEYEGEGAPGNGLEIPAEGKSIESEEIILTDPKTKGESIESEEIILTDPKNEDNNNELKNSPKNNYNLERVRR